MLSTTDRGDTMVREYVVNHDDQQLTQVWSYGIDDGRVGSTNGDAHRLDNGNTLHNLGAGGMIREVNEDGEHLWVVDFGDGHLLGQTLWIEDLYDFVDPPE